METRTLVLTHEELLIIKRALGIAENSFAALRKQYITNLVNVRGVDNLTETRLEADVLFKNELAFCNLLLAIDNGEKDS